MYVPVHRYTCQHVAKATEKRKVPFGTLQPLGQDSKKKIVHVGVHVAPNSAHPPRL